MWALHEEEMDLSTHTSREKAGAFESEKSSSLYFELILTTVHVISRDLQFNTVTFTPNYLSNDDARRYRSFFLTIPYPRSRFIRHNSASLFLNRNRI